eukprot:5006234-Pyramimonas_sp.AAC.1
MATRSPSGERAITDAVPWSSSHTSPLAWSWRGHSAPAPARRPNDTIMTQRHNNSRGRSRSAVYHSHSTIHYRDSTVYYSHSTLDDQSRRHRAPALNY